jgi:hypothetical protein
MTLTSPRKRRHKNSAGTTTCPRSHLVRSHLPTPDFIFCSYTPTHYRVYLKKLSCLICTWKLHNCSSCKLFNFGYLLLAGMSYPGSWKEGDGDYLLVVKEQPGWADVYSSQGHRRGEMQGWCRLKDREDADAVFSMYTWSQITVRHN